MSKSILPLFVGWNGRGNKRSGNIFVSICAHVYVCVSGCVSHPIVSHLIYCYLTHISMHSIFLPTISCSYFMINMESFRELRVTEIWCHLFKLVGVGATTAATVFNGIVLSF